MLLFNPCRNDFAPHSLAVTPTRIFVEGAIKALREASKQSKNIILDDLAAQVDCNREDLSFLIEAQCPATDMDIALPDFRAALMA